LGLFYFVKELELMEIKVVRQILEWNIDCSNEVKDILWKKNIYMINVMGSPGAGKTSLIIELIKQLRERYRVAVIEGDIAGKIDAEKIDSMGIPVVQLNTEGACHIEAMSIKNILEYFDLENLDIIFIENIGNLVCPAEFQIGEDLRISILSVPEGDDKPEKYPLMFTETDTLVINKHDMSQYFEFDDNRVENITKAYNPNISVFKVSSKSGEGVAEFTGYLVDKINSKLNGAH
jgi:hydrogenase nickel incorporation protein HypB